MLTETQREVLLRGLSFVPAPKNQETQKTELLRGLQEYHRRVKLETFFEGERKRKEKVPLTYGSDWTPHLSRLLMQVSQIIEADLCAYRHLHCGRREKNL